MVSDALVDLVSGSAGGVANVVVGQPMDTVKVLRQDLVFVCWKRPDYLVLHQYFVFKFW